MGHPEAVGNAKNHRCRTEHGHARKHVNADSVSDRPDRQPQRTETRSNAGGRAQIAEYVRSGMQDVPSERRQQCGGAANSTANK